MPRSLRNLLFLAACLLALTSETSPRAQTADSAVSLTPGPKPPDVPVEWKQLVGIYRHGQDNATVIVLERDQRLFFRDAKGTGGDGRTYAFTEDRDVTGSVIALHHLLESYTRVDAGSDPAHFYRVRPVKPIDQLRAIALAERPPEETGPFRKPELAELVTLDAGFHLDIRYARADNFLGTPVYSEARAFLERPAAEALVRVLHKLEPLGYGLLVHDAYRPWYVTKIFWDATPAEGKIFVADPKKGSRHNRGCAVD